MSIFRAENCMGIHLPAARPVATDVPAKETPKEDPDRRKELKSLIKGGATSLSGPVCEINIFAPKAPIVINRICWTDEHGASVDCFVPGAQKLSATETQK